jgi:hypothetical protein
MHVLHSVNTSSNELNYNFQVYLGRFLSIDFWLTLNAVVSYRSVPRILELFKSKTNYAIGWVPPSLD